MRKFHPRNPPTNHGEGTRSTRKNLPVRQMKIPQRDQGRIEKRMNHQKDGNGNQKVLVPLMRYRPQDFPKISPRFPQDFPKIS